MQGHWRLIPYSWDSSSRKQYFEIDSDKIVFKRIFIDSDYYSKRGDTLFVNNSKMNRIDTIIIQMLNNDSAQVKGTHKEEGYYIVREKQ